MATLALRRIRAGIAGAPAREDGRLRSVALRLATQTVGLLLVMIVALELLVYLTMQHVLLQSLETTLKQRAAQVDPNFCLAVDPGCAPRRVFGFGSPGEDGGTFAPGSNGPPVRAQRSNPSDTSVVFLDAGLTILHGDGPHNNVVMDAAAARQVLQSGREICCTNSDLEHQTYLVYTRPMISADGQPLAVQASISEYQYEGTMHFLLEELLAAAVLGLLISGGISAVLVGRALEPIRAAMQRQRDFVADAAHELRTPLAIQRTVAEVGLADPLPTNREATLEQMLVENKHLTRLVDDLSLLARADSNAITIQRAPMNLSSLVADTVTELAPLAEEQDIALVADVAPGVWVQGDIMRLRQLLLVLLDNALKHTPSGGEITARVQTRGGRARLSVQDTGPGIDPADLPRIFDRFYRADKARAGEGSGLGLAIAQWIVQAHSGQIQAGNDPSGGAVFTASLPLAAPGS